MSIRDSSINNRTLNDDIWHKTKTLSLSDRPIKVFTSQLNKYIYDASLSIKKVKGHLLTILERTKKPFSISHIDTTIYIGI